MPDDDYDRIRRRYDLAARRHAGENVLGPARRAFFDELAAILREKGVPLDAPALDLGCGRGDLGLAFGNTRLLTGVDLSPEAARVARDQRGYGRVVVGEVTAALAEIADRFPVVYALLLFEMTPDPAAALTAAARALAPGGWLVAVTPRFRSKYYRAWRWKSRLGALLGVPPLPQNENVGDQIAAAAGAVARLAPVARRPWLDGARLAGDLFPGRLAFLGRPLVGLTPGYRESFELFLFRAKG